MAIELIKKVTILSPKGSDKRLMKTISLLGVMEVIDLGEVQEAGEPSLERSETSTEEADERLHQIDFILNLMNLFSPEKQSFVEGLAPVPLVTTQEEINSVLEQLDLERQYKIAGELDEEHRSAERVIGEIENELREIGPLSDLSFNIAGFHRPVRTRLVLGHLPVKSLPLLDESVEPWARAAWEEIESGTVSGPGAGPPERRASAPEAGEERVRVVVAFRTEDNEPVRKALTSIGFDEIQLPDFAEKISERIEELRSDLVEYRQKADEVVEKVKILAQGTRAGGGRRPLLILRAYWQSIKNTQLASTKGLRGRWVHVIGGYVREKDREKLLAILAKEFPESEVTVQDPGPDEDVPVSITVPNLFRPIQLLVEMFGLPAYKAFDPTPFLQVNFFLFFGICFSDVCYGLMLTALGAYLSARTKPYRGLNNFSRILLYGGISSILFGAVLGSWFGDLYKPDYLGKGNPLLRLQEMFVILDPIDKTIVALLCALGIGICNQFYGIILKMYGALKNRDYLGAFSDGICWLATLSGVLMMVGKIFTEIPPALFNTGFWLFVAGAAGLVLTQGRDFKNPLSKLAGGLVSLYGIMGSYGITAFIGDTLSYCRLLALGLTTSIVAMTFNLMAGMLRDVPYVGFLLFLTVLVVGHLFNFCISVLGAFVHSMRLIFVEFFGRFYEGGSRSFRPLGFDSPSCIVKRSGETGLSKRK
jgi:V/A-type H+/Na+-transporting ATPase subunit I